MCTIDRFKSTNRIDPHFGTGRNERDWILEELACIYNQPVLFYCTIVDGCTSSQSQQKSTLEKIHLFTTTMIMCFAATIACRNCESACTSSLSEPRNSAVDVFVNRKINSHCTNNNQPNIFTAFRRGKAAALFGANVGLERQRQLSSLSPPIFQASSLNNRCSQ
jgi:hypothetical protein